MKKHKETFLLEFFSLVRKERKGQKEEGIPLLNTFRRLAATGANKVPRPSRYSLTTATGSKRSSADSDSLLCHVRLWQTSRFRFGCASVCEHSKIKFALHNTHVTPHPPLSRSPFCPSLGDADRVCSANRSIPHWRRLIVTSRQRTYSTHDAPSRRRQHTCFAYVLIPAVHFQRACRQCVHESARLFRVICLHAW